MLWHTPHTPLERTLENMRSGILATLGIALVTLVGCGGTVALDGTGGTGATGGAGGAGSAGPTTVSTTDGAPAPAGCTASSECGGGAFCDWTDGSCGANGAVGTCTPLSDGAGGEVKPVCGCDGMTYDNADFAAFYGVSVKSQGPCEPFACGPMTCDPSTQYCAYSPDIQQPAPPPYACQPLPAACGVTPSCDCLSDICGTCSGDPATGLTKYCPGEG